MISIEQKALRGRKSDKNTQLIRVKQENNMLIAQRKRRIFKKDRRILYVFLKVGLL